MTSGISRDDWLKALEEAGCHDSEDDQQAVTIEEFAEMFQLSRATAERRLRHLDVKGLAMRTRKRAPAMDGRVVQYVAYRLVTP